MPVLSKTGRSFDLPDDNEEAAINAGIAADEDTYELSEAEFSTLKPRGRPKAETVKVPLSIRLSPEVVEAFKATGKGWQTRIDEVLKAWVREHSGG